MSKALIQGTIASEPIEHCFLKKVVGIEYYVQLLKHPDKRVLIVLTEPFNKLILSIGQKVEVVGEKHLKQHTHEMYVKVEEINFSFAGDE